MKKGAVQQLQKVNVTKFKKELVLRGRKNKLITYNADLMACKGVQRIY